MKTSISWTDYSLNFVKWTCKKVSEGCANCYMFELSKRYPQNATDPKENPVWRQKAIDELYKIPTGAFVFVGDMYDTYYEKMPTEWIHRVHNLITYERPDLIFQLLTKRPERALQLAPYLSWPENLWLGVSVENEKYEWRIDYLRDIPAKTKFISFEPLLGDVGYINLAGIDWAIVGAESGDNRRCFDKQWARNILKQCGKYDTAFFYKQSSGRFPGTDDCLDGKEYKEFPGNKLPLKYQVNAGIASDKIAIPDKKPDAVQLSFNF